jgi:ribosomal protein S18 acetylase RimI-like enzyme
LADRNRRPQSCSERRSACEGSGVLLYAVHMSAAVEYRVPEVLDLRRIRLEDLNPVLEEETIAWRDRLHWDFTPSADLVRRFVGIQALSGYALAVNGRVIGYSYFVCEDRKGLIGDLYVLDEFRESRNEQLLLSAIVEALARESGVRRIESQLMMLDSAFSHTLPKPNLLRLHRRNFMVAELPSVSNLSVGLAADSNRFEGWLPYRQEETARLIAEAYQGHVDSDINDQYRSIAGARRFLMNIVQYPGCGSFFQPASFCAADPQYANVRGVSLASLVSAQVGHITQICVAPKFKGLGIGYELLRRSLVAFAGHGCTEATLTVTTENDHAVHLYERMGFRTLRYFAACVWDGL